MSTSDRVLRRLALAAARGDREAAIVLGDAVMETYGTGREGRFGGIETGRVRPIHVFFARRRSTSSRGLLSPEEQHAFDDLWSQIRPAGTWTFVPVSGREVIYNTVQFAANPTTATWNNIFTQWVTSKRDIYRALVRHNALPSTIRFRELVWNTIPILQADLWWELYVERIPVRRKLPQQAYLFTVMRPAEEEALS